MADQKFTSSILKQLINRIDEGDLSPGSIAKKYGTKDAVISKYREISSYLDKYRPDIADREAFDLWKNVKNRLENKFETGRKYANVPVKNTNIDDLNKGEAIKVSAKDSAAQILEQDASKIDPLTFKQAQNAGEFTPSYNQLQKMDIADAKQKALSKLIPEEESLLKMAAKDTAKVGSALGHVKGVGKIAAIGAGLAAAGNAMAGEPVDMNAIGSGVASAFTPIAVDAAMGTMSEDQPLTEDQYRLAQAQMKAQSDAARVDKDIERENANNVDEELKRMQNMAKFRKLQSYQE